MKLALIFCVSVTVNRDDADRWTGCVRDDDWLGQHSGGSRWGHTSTAECCGGDTPKNTTSRQH